MKKQFLILFAFISVLAFGQSTQRFYKVLATGDMTSPKFIKTGSTIDSVLLGNGSARAISTIKTDTVSLSNRINAKAAGTGTANGTNTGDETLTSIKTKLGAASAVSDGYLTSNMFNVFNNSEPSFTKRTGFNKNFGTTPGTVLEGRTFGTAANSAVGDFQPIENQRLSTANSPSFNKMTSTVATGTAPLTVNSTTMVGNLTSQYLGGNNYTSPDLNTLSSLGRFSVMQVMNTSANIFPYTSNANAVITIDTFDGSETYKQQLGFNGSGDIYSRYGNNSWSKLYHSGNLTNYLSNNYIPKWNGSTFVNATAGTDYQLPITLTTNGTSGAATFSGNVLNVPNYTNTGFSYGSYTPTLTNVSGVSGFNTISARYTTIGGITTVSIKFVVVASSTSCTFNISLPRSATSSALFLTGNANSSPSSVINGSYLDANNAQVTETFPVATNFINTIVITYE